jgi:hypothetical protein
MSLGISDSLYGPSEPLAATPGPEKPHISPSSIDTFTKCGEKWRRRYVMRERRPPRLRMIKGTAVHRGAEWNYKQKIESRVDVAVNLFKEYSAAAFDTEVNAGFELDTEERAIGKDKVLGEAKDSAVKLAELYATESAPQYQPRAVEARVLIVLPSATHNLLSIADLVTEDDIIVENKTGKKWSQDRADLDPQLTFQAMTFRALYGYDPRKIVVENLVVNKVKDPYRNVVDTQRAETDYTAMINRINTVLDAINKGVYPPANPSGWWCAPDQCEFFDSCSFVAKR